MNILIGNTEFPFNPSNGLSKAYILQTVKKANKHRQKLLVQLHSLGKDDAKRASQLRYAKSKGVWLSAILEAANRLPPEKRKTIEEYILIAASLRNLLPLTEPVHVHRKAKKKSGEYRTHCTYGTAHRAAQRILGDMLDDQFTPRHWQYGVRGRGVGHAIRDIRKLHAAGFRYAAVLDIKQFFDSFSPMELLTKSLPVLYELKLVAAVGLKMNLKKGGDEQHQSDQYLLALQQSIHSLKASGLPQGSAFSAKVAIFFISRMLLPLIAHVRILNYVDDFVILAKTAEKLETAKHALHASVGAIPVGKFELLEQSSGSFSQQFVYLGHVIHENAQGALEIRPTTAMEQKMTNDVQEQFGLIISDAKLKGKQEPELTRRLAKIVNRWSGWLANFGETDDIEEYRAFVAMHVEHAAQALGTSAYEVNAQAAELPKYQWNGYGD